MADLTITVANVEYTSGQKINATAGATITAGDAVYLDASDANKVKPAHNTTSSATATCVGIALHGSLDEQPVTYLQNGGVMDLGATLTVGETYVLAADGAISPVGDVASSDYVTHIGIAKATDSITLNIFVSGVQKT